MTTQEKATAAAGVADATTAINAAAAIKATPVAIPMEALREHWQGHRRVTRRVIEAFPDKAFETYSIGGMRPFSELALEMIGMAEPGMKGIVTGNWAQDGELEHHVTGSVKHDKTHILRRWDEVTALIDRLWPGIPQGRLEQVEAAFGLYNQPIYNTLLYFIDNEIHHRGQGYVYLRSLGIEPPAFWDRR
jgi:uncharacterized damage-inducible protein DinB